LNDKTPETIAKRARALGISYLLIRSKENQAAFQKAQDFVLDKDFGRWHLYRLNIVAPESMVLKYEPVLMFSELGLKGTDVRSIDFFFLQEKIFINSRFDLTIAKANTKLDDLTDLQKFSTAIVSEYSYKSKEVAKKNLKVFATSKRLILVASQDPLYAELKQELRNNPRVVFVDYNSTLSGNARMSQLFKVADKILTELDTHKIPLVATSTVNTAIHGSHIEISLATPVKNPVPMKMNVSYFPSWKRTDAEPVYLATPSYMLTFMENSAEIRFTTPLFVYAGWGVSLVSLLAFGIMIYKRK
jgi:hypothetical protein